MHFIKDRLDTLKFSRARRSIFKNLKPGDLCIDCGANVGTVSREMAKKGAVVHAFEPNPHAFAELEKNLARFQQVFCYEKGVGNRNANLELYLHRLYAKDQIWFSSGSTFVAEKTSANLEDSRTVEVVRLSEFIKGLNQTVRWLKIDIEGMEYEVLEDLIDTGCMDSIGYITVETHLDRIPGLEKKDQAIKARLQELGLNNVDWDWG